MRILALYDIHGNIEALTAYDSAAAGRRMLEAGWADEQSVAAALTDPVEAIVVTRIFEDRATSG